MPEDDVPAVAAGLKIGISVSASEDLERFGVTETHVAMALAEIARAVLIADGRLLYGGHLEEDGYTAFLTKEVERLGRRNRPFQGYIPFPVHREMATEQIKARVADLGLLGRYTFLDPDGKSIDPAIDRPEAPDPVDESTAKRSLTAARHVIANEVDGQVVLGGKRSGFLGRMPGVVEEAILTMRAKKPLFIAGGFGGAAGDIVAALGLDPANWLGLRDGSTYAYMAEIEEALNESGWVATSNGLTDEENHRLAITYRASEIASLIITGLSRLTGRRSR